MSKSIMHFLVTLLLAQNCLAGEKSLVQQAETVLKNASTYFHSISTRGGYVGIYSLDLKKRYGEALYEEARATEIWVQPPGTPSVGECFLRAYRITGEKQYLTAATDAACALAWGQRTAGGWGHRVDVAHLDRKSITAILRDGRCTFDDNITQGALSFLMSMDAVIDELWLSEAIELGLKHMMKSQFENGAWPQWYPLIGGYHDYYTFWARSFEPPGVCSAATIRNIQTLVDLYLYTKENRYLEPIPLAFEWLDKSKIGDNKWARLYEEGTNKPLYGDREDGYKMHYVYESLSEFERKSYSWQGQYGINAAARYYNDVKSLGADSFIARRDKGRWINNNMITCKDFVMNVNMLCEYLELSGRKQ